MVQALPPGRVWASKIVTSWPACVSSKPAERPASPAPTMMTFFAGPRGFSCCGTTQGLVGNNEAATEVPAVQAKNSLRAIFTFKTPTAKPLHYNAQVSINGEIGN